MQELNLLETDKKKHQSKSHLQTISYFSFLKTKTVLKK